MIDNIHIKEKIIKLINEIKNKYPELYIDYKDYDNGEIYEIWHNNENLDFDSEFNNFVGELLVKLEVPFNVFICYNDELTDKIYKYKLKSNNLYSITNNTLNIDILSLAA